MSPRNGDLACSGELQGRLLNQLKGSGERKKLKRIAERRCVFGSTSSDCSDVYCAF